jgi:flagellin-like protein
LVNLNSGDDIIYFKHHWKDEEGVSPVIAVILLVAITVVLVSVLYFTVSGMIDETKMTPVGAFNFREHETIEGQFTGGIISVSSKVYIDDVSLTVVDAESGGSDIIHPMAEGQSAQAGPPGSQINITYDDEGKMGVLDSSDVFFVTGATHGDKVILTYIPSDDRIALWSTPI